MTFKTAPTYAVAGGPPHDWMDLEIWDIVQEQLVTDVVEINTAEGWLIKYALDAKGKPVLDGPANNPYLKKVKVHGRFMIRYRVEKRK
jgi:hypothetical protein